MAEKRYFDLDVVVERAGEGYRARIDSPAGQAESRFNLPFSDTELENFVLKVGRRRGVRRVEAPETEAAKSFGGSLFKAVFAGEAAGCLQSSLFQAEDQDAGLRIRLDLHGVPELADVPWEYLYNAGRNRFLALSENTPIVRYVSLPERRKPLKVTPPLKVLAMIASPRDFPPLDVEKEWGRLQEALADLEQAGLLTLERLEEASLSALQRRLRLADYHIFHFVGHGGFDTKCEEGVLILEDEEKRGRQIAAQHLGTILHDERSLRLAVLNACEGARASRTDPFAGTAQCLVQQGIPAVIAMQFEVTDEAAVALAHEFYRALADGYPVDAALSDARKLLYGGQGGIEWGTPVLYMRSPDGVLFDVERLSDEAGRKAKAAGLYRDAQTALAAENWAGAIEILHRILALEPSHSEAAARLQEAQENQEVARRFAAGQEHQAARRWREALGEFQRVHAMRPHYKNVAALAAAVQQELAKASQEEQRREQAVALYREAHVALARQDWKASVEKLQAVLKADPRHEDAAGWLRHARHQLELAALFESGRKHHERRRWREALADLDRVREQGGAYAGLDALIASARSALESEVVIPRPPVPRPPAVRSRWGGLKLLSIGGCLGALALVLLVGLLIMAVAAENCDTSDAGLTPTPTTYIQPGIATVCDYGTGFCPMVQPVPIGSSCFCNTLYGQFQGHAR